MLKISAKNNFHTISRSPKICYITNMKKTTGEIMTVVSVIVTALALVVGYSWHRFSKKSDTCIEEIAEEIIEHESGIKIDFSAQDKPKEQDLPPK